MEKQTPRGYQPNVIDKTIAIFSPARALKRAQARIGLEYIEKHARRFDGASKSSRFEQWRRPGTSANSSILPALPLLRNASRDLTRNNPWAENAVRVIVNNTVGGGIMGQVALLRENDTRQKALYEYWWRWAETTEIDADGRHDLAGLEALAMACIAESGEVLIRRRYRRPGTYNVIPVQIQVMEPDFLDDSKDGSFDDGRQIVGGIEYDKYGKITHYWLREYHPGDANAIYRNGFKSYRVRASEIIHAFDPKRAGQGRGYPWCAAAIRRLKDFDDYEDAQLVRQKIAACFAGFVEDMAPPTGATGLEKTGPKEDQKDYMQPGLWEFLPPGKKISFANPPTVQNYGEYGRFNLMGSAAAYGITYEAMTGDYSNVNFSSGRMGWLEMNRNITRWQSTIMRTQILERVASWFFGGLTLAGVDSEGAYMKWIMPRREMIDPTKEVPAGIKSLRAGLTSLPRLHASMGLDTSEILKEIADTNKELDKLGITLDSDPRKVNSAGSKNDDDEGDPPANRREE